MRKALIALLIVAMGIGSAEAKRELTRAERDSVTYALATIWAKYLHNKASKDSPEETAQYMGGLTEALKLADKGSQYYVGLQDGIVIDSRLQQVEEMGGFTVDRQKLAAIFENAAKGRTTRFTPETADAYMNRIMTALAADESVVKDSEAWLDSIAGRDGVHKSLTGMLYEVVSEGDGSVYPRSQSCDVVVEYEGRLYNGKVFDRTEEGKTARFNLSSLIPGFAEGLYLMSPGSHYRIYLPAELAYGEQGVPGVIPSNAALEFDVVLRDVITNTPSNQ